MCQVFYGCFYSRLVIWCEVDCAAGARFKMPVNLMNCIIDLYGNDYRGNSTAFYASFSSLSVCGIIWWKHFTLIGLSFLFWCGHVAPATVHAEHSARAFGFGSDTRQSYDAWSPQLRAFPWSWELWANGIKTTEKSCVLGNQTGAPLKAVGFMIFECNRCMYLNVIWYHVLSDMSKFHLNIFTVVYVCFQAN